MLALGKPYKFRLWLGIFFGFLAGLFEPLMVLTVVFVYSVIFQDVSKFDTQSWWKKLPESLRNQIIAWIQSPEAHSNWLALLVLIGAIPAVFFLRGLATYLNTYLVQWASIRAISDLRVRLFNHLLNLPASFFSAARSADLMSRVLADTEVMRTAIGNSLISMVKDPVTVLTMFVVLFWQQPMLTTISFIVLPVCILPISIYGRKGRRATAGAQELSGDLANSMIESFAGIRIVKAYNLESAVSGQFQRLSMQYVSNFMRMVRSLETPGPLLEFAGSIGVALLLTYAVLRPKDRPDGAAFLMLVGAVISIYRPIKSIVRLHAQMEQSRAAGDRVFDVLATKSHLVEPANPKPLKAVGADIQFNNVSFSYGEKPVLQEIQFVVKAGKLFALVGASGSGKTTLTNLLLRFYDPTSGAIRIGGVDIRDVTTRTLRENIAVVTQETILFNDSIRNNIALGRPGATEAEIIAAAKHAFAHDFIMQKSQGYDTMIGERGVALSGGQRQRLAIARAILKDAPILVLDEATSALDTESERTVQSALEELMVGRTTICIAHRLSTIQRADVIVAMQEGRIVEMGAHAELLEKKGLYFNLHQLTQGA